MNMFELVKYLILIGASSFSFDKASIPITDNILNSDLITAIDNHIVYDSTYTINFVDSTGTEKELYLTKSILTTSYVK